ncbi:peptidase C26 [Parazoarcus communis]|uniref:Peptidase C26 n=1 Tax=Parazoarcus communis TaxID=41977 RepID=A0A2U8GT29_9RHOO|nr:peptidase C26 [Parazoarcus communis]
MARPLIAITGPEKGAAGPRALVAGAVRWYGGKPVHIRPSDRSLQHHYDGVVITGGHDVNPALYAAEPEVEPLHDTERDALEMHVIELSLARRLPILGICRGAQLLNVFRGGSLFQELRSRRRRTSNRWTVLPLKRLHVESGSMLARLVGDGTQRINSLHNQAIDRAGEGLRISGRDLDGIVQAIEDPDYGFLLGVQWHPEFLLPMVTHRALFKALVDSARQYADTRRARENGHNT